MLIKMLSWNVNGLRAVAQKPEWTDWFADNQAQIIGLQETKASPEQLEEELARPEGWLAVWDSSVLKKGYSGTAVFSRLEPLKVTLGLPDQEYQGEGRLIHLEFAKFHYFNGYFPNGGAQLDDGSFKRLGYKLGFLNAFAAYAQECRKTKPIVVCGDFNIAHEPIDLARPKENEKNTGFLPVERDWLSGFLELGYIDSFRHVNGARPESYSWWSYRAGARRRNIGWRLDYFFVSAELKDNIRHAWIEKDVLGSDHCPVGLALEI